MCTTCAGSGWVVLVAADGRIVDRPAADVAEGAGVAGVAGAAWPCPDC